MVAVVIPSGRNNAHQCNGALNPNVPDVRHNQAVPLENSMPADPIHHLMIARVAGHIVLRSMLVTSDTPRSFR